jgi:acetolactate synthase-1/2/3 large subunit
LIAGSAAGYTLSGDSLQRFIETTRLPLLTEEQSRGLVSDDHPYVFGFFERGLNRAAAKVRDADVIVLLGRKQDYVIGFCRPPNVRADAKIIQIDPSALEIGRNRGVAVGMVGDVASILDQMTKEASNHTWKDLPWLEELRAARAAQAEWSETLARPQTPMHALFVHKTIKSLLRPDDCLVFDGGDFWPLSFTGAQTKALVQRFESRNVGFFAAHGARCQNSLSRIASHHDDGRRGLWFQRDGIRHRGAPQVKYRGDIGQRCRLGH